MIVSIIPSVTVLQSGLSFEQALRLLKEGEWIAREPWNYQPIKMQGDTIVDVVNGQPWIGWDRHHHPLLRNDWQWIERTDLGG